MLKNIAREIRGLVEDDVLQGGRPAPEASDIKSDAALPGPARRAAPSGGDASE